MLNAKRDCRIMWQKTKTGLLNHFCQDIWNTICYTNNQIHKQNKRKLAVPQYSADYATPLHPEIRTGFSGKTCCAQKRRTGGHGTSSQQDALTNLNTTSTALKVTLYIYSIIVHPYHLNPSSSSNICSLGCIECIKCRLLLWMIPVSVCHAVQLAFTVQNAVWGEHSWRPKEHCVRRGSWSPLTVRGEDSMQPLPNYFGLMF